MKQDALILVRGGGDLVGRGLGSCHRGIRRGGAGVAVSTRRLLGRCLHKIVLVVEDVVAVFVLGVVFRDLLVGVGIAVVLLLRILRGELAELQHVTRDLLGHAVAVGRLEILADGVVLILLGSELNVG